MKNLFPMLVVAAIVIGGTAYFVSDEGGRIDEADSSAVQPDSSPTASGVENVGHLSASVNGSQVSQVNLDAPTKAVKRSDIYSTDIRLVALTADEAAWLDRHGYPRPEALAKLHLMDSEQLLRDARAGDGMAASLLGIKALEEGDYSHALSAFDIGQFNGSLYARQRAAELVATSSPDGLVPLNNDTRAILIAGLEVAQMLGDHRAGALADRLGREFDRRRYGYAVQQQSVEFMRQYSDSYSSRGLQAPGPDPRPNAALWARIDAGTDPDEVITIIDRGG